MHARRVHEDCHRLKFNKEIQPSLLNHVLHTVELNTSYFVEVKAKDIFSNLLLIYCIKYLVFTNVTVY